MRRDAKKLKTALLGVPDLPTGWSVASGRADGAGPSSTTSDPKCTALNEVLNASGPDGSLADAAVDFDGGQDGPFVSQRLDSMGTSKAARGFVSGLRRAAEGCSKITLRVPGQGSSSMVVSEVSPPRVGKAPFVVRLTASGGALDGLEVTFLWAPVDDVLLSLNLINAYPDELDGIATDAGAKLTDTLELSDQTT